MNDSNNSQPNEQPSGSKQQSELVDAAATTSTNVSEDAPQPPSAKSAPEPPEKRELLLHNEPVEVPYKLFQSEEILRSVLNKEAFYSLSESSRAHLIKNFLPQEVTSNMDDALDHIFSKSPSVGFVPPLTNFYNRVQAGFHDRPHGSDCVQLRDFHKVLHNHFIRNHHMKLLRHLVQVRHQILENAFKQGASEELRPKVRAPKRKPRKREKLEKRSRKRVAMMLSKVNEVVGVDNVRSSDDSEAEDSRAPLPMFPEAESTLFDAFYKDADLDLHQPAEIASVKKLLRDYKELRERNPECPSLDIDDITLESVYDRMNISYQTEKNYAQALCKKLDDASSSVSKPASQN